MKDLLFHDLRRSAARNLIRVGISDTVAMQLIGHRTASIFRRYAIVDEKMLKEQAAKLQTLRPERKVQAHNFTVAILSGT